MITNWSSSVETGLRFRASSGSGNYSIAFFLVQFRSKVLLQFSNDANQRRRLTPFSRGENPETLRCHLVAGHPSPELFALFNRSFACCSILRCTEDQWNIHLKKSQSTNF